MKLNKINPCFELLKIIAEQNETINTQNDIIAKLINENAEQENMINELMKGEFT